jgi:hypothetical protein
MRFSPGLRKFVLTVHVMSSVGWLGAVGTYLALDVTAFTSDDVQTVRSAHIAMQAVVSTVIVPLALTSVLVGILNALGTPWGLFRHYWVLAKLLLTVFATTILLIEAPTVGALAQSAASIDDPRELPGTLVHSIGGLLVLLIITSVSVYKPRGTTRYGWRKQQQQRGKQQEPRGVPAP